MDRFPAVWGLARRDRLSRGARWLVALGLLPLAALPLPATPLPEEWPAPAAPPAAEHAAPRTALPQPALPHPADPLPERPGPVPKQVAVGDLTPATAVAARGIGDGAATGWQHPLADEVIEQAPWGWRWSAERGSWRMHTGVDLIVAEGTPVHAAAGAVVLLAEPVAGYGLTVLLDHGDGWQTLYAHLRDLAVQPGQRLHRGEVLGWVGQTGRATTPHLHLELRRRGQGGMEALDPQPLLQAPRPVLPALAAEARSGASELLFHLWLDAAVGGGITDAQQRESRCDLVVVQEALVGLINAARDDAAGAGAASSGAAGEGQVDAVLFGRIENVGVVGAAEAAAVFQGDREGGHGETSETLRCGSIRSRSAADSCDPRHPGERIPMAAAAPLA